MFTSHSHKAITLLVLQDESGKFKVNIPRSYCEDLPFPGPEAAEKTPRLRIMARGD
jgi:hypothetical protein